LFWGASVGVFFVACCGLCFVRHFCLCPAVLCIYLNYSFYIYIILQEKIDTVTVEGDENVGEEECVKIKTEQHYIQLVRIVKIEQEVSFLCCMVVIYLQVCVHACCTLYLVTHTLCTCISRLIFCM
jgi:hypothetical protein